MRNPFKKGPKPRGVKVASSTYGARTTTRIMLDMLRVKREIKELNNQSYA